MADQAGASELLKQVVMALKRIFICGIVAFGISLNASAAFCFGIFKQDSQPILTRAVSISDHDKEVLAGITQILEKIRTESSTAAFFIRFGGKAQNAIRIRANGLLVAAEILAGKTSPSALEGFRSLPPIVTLEDLYEQVTLLGATDYRELNTELNRQASSGQRQDVNAAFNTVNAERIRFIQQLKEFGFSVEPYFRGSSPYYSRSYWAESMGRKRLPVGIAIGFLMDNGNGAPGEGYELSQHDFTHINDFISNLNSGISYYVQARDFRRSATTRLSPEQEIELRRRVEDIVRREGPNLKPFLGNLMSNFVIASSSIFANELNRLGFLISLYEFGNGLMENLTLTLNPQLLLKLRDQIQAEFNGLRPTKGQFLSQAMPLILQETETVLTQGTLANTRAQMLAEAYWMTLF